MKRETLMWLMWIMGSISCYPQFNTISSDVATHKRITQNTEAATAPNENDTHILSALPLSTITVTSPFGNRRDPLNGKYTFHNGIDLKARYEEVYAMFYGQVIAVGEDNRSGKYITLRHGDITISYCHLAETYVNNGDIVAPGIVIALSGNSGRTTGPHLHMTCKIHGEYVNPTLIIDAVKEKYTSVDFR